MQQYNTSLQMGCSGILEELDIETVSEPLSRSSWLSMQEPDDHLRLAHAITLNSSLDPLLLNPKEQQIFMFSRSCFTHLG
jgi:hypothetical protein